jgi:hypothetical protein
MHARCISGRDGDVNLRQENDEGNVHDPVGCSDAASAELTCGVVNNGKQTVDVVPSQVSTEKDCHPELLAAICHS